MAGTVRTASRMLHFLDLSDSSQCHFNSFFSAPVFSIGQKFEEAQTHRGNLVEVHFPGPHLEAGSLLHWSFWALWFRGYKGCLCSCHVPARHTSHCPTSVTLILTLGPGGDRPNPPMACFMCTCACNLTLSRVLQYLFP